MKADLAIDLGSANLKIYSKDQGLIFNEPTTVAVNLTTSKIIGLGEKAKELIGNVPGYVALRRPISGGVISDFALTREMLNIILKRFKKFKKPRVLICLPNKATPLEQKVFGDVFIQAGAKSVEFIPQAIAAAIEFNLPIDEAFGCLIVDLGASLTQATVISMKKISVAYTSKTGGNDLDQLIADYLKKSYNLALPDKTIEQLKIMLGAANKSTQDLSAELLGHDITTGLERNITITQKELAVAINPFFSEVIKVIKNTLANCPVELAGDLISKGGYLTGGGARLRNLPELLKGNLNLDFHVPKDPLIATVKGAGKLLD